METYTEYMAYNLWTSSALNYLQLFSTFASIQQFFNHLNFLLYSWISQIATKKKKNECLLILRKYTKETCFRWTPPWKYGFIFFNVPKTMGTEDCSYRYILGTSSSHQSRGTFSLVRRRTAGSVFFFVCCVCVCVYFFMYWKSQSIPNEVWHKKNNAKKRCYVSCFTIPSEEEITL